MTPGAHDKAAAMCTFCPSLCRHVCPVGLAEGREAVTPQAKMAMLGRLRAGSETWSAEAASVLHACNGCGLCTRACAHEIDVSSALMFGRAEAVEHGAGHARLAGVPRRFFMRAARRRKTLAARFGDRVVASADVAYLPGCGAWHDDGSSVARDLDLLRRFGLGDLPVADLPFAAAGYALLACGQDAELRRVAAQTHAAAGRFGELISDCPACVWMLRDVYLRLDLRPGAHVRHTSEALFERLDAVRPVRRPVRALYQDACLLGRHLGIREPPRRLAAACVGELVEPGGGQEQAPCSGGGGLIPWTAPSTATRTAARRLDEAREASCALVVAACPTATRTLRKGGRGTAVVGLMDLLAAATRTV